MAEKTYRLKIARGDQEFEAEGDKAFVLEMLKRFESSEAAIDVQSSAKSSKSYDRPERKSVKIANGKSASVSEFIRQVGFKKHTDIVLAFGYYLEQQGVKDFTPADINNCYYEAKMENSNTSQMVILNIRRGYMMESKGTTKGRQRYTLTQSGVSFVTAKGAKSEAA